MKRHIQTKRMILWMIGALLLVSGCSDEAGGTSEETLQDTSGTSGTDASTSGTSGTDASTSGTSGTDASTSGTSGTDASTSGTSGTDASTSGTSGADVPDTSDAPAPSCTNGVRDGDESDIDCGGPCTACDTGEFCFLPTDCAVGICADGICACINGDCNPPPNCLDGTLTCDDNATCMLSRVSGFCVCNDGYSGDGTTCDDTNECLSGLIDCGANAACENTPGGYDCACDDGFVKNTQGECVDALDCAAGPAVCGANASCVSASDGAFCLCDGGYVGDGATCDDDNECTRVRCAPNSECVNLPGSFECRCIDGYAPDRTGACADIDECADDTLNTCAPGATCANTDGGYDCACDRGLFGDGMACAPTSCLGHYALGVRTSGVLPIDPDGDGPAPVIDALCDMTTAGGGWTSLNHGPGLASLNYTLPFSEVALSSGARFWVLTPTLDTTYEVLDYNTLPAAMYQALAATPAQTGWLWNGTSWPNPDTCHATQQLILVTDPSQPPRNNGNPHINGGFGMPTAVSDAATPTTDLLGAAPLGAYPSIHIGCVGWNVLQDPIVWTR